MAFLRSWSSRSIGLWRTILLGGLIGRIAASNIDVSLKASWNGAPFLLELLESAAQEQPESYFPLLDKLASGAFEKEKTDEAIYTKFIKTAKDAGFLIAPEVESLFSLSASVRSASPAIEAHYHYYQDTLKPSLGSDYKGDCPVWLHWGGKQVCGGEDIEKALSKATSDSEGAQKQIAFDRILEKGEGAPAPAAVLYADITSKDFKRFHELLAKQARDGKISYRVRYRPSPGYDKADVMLSGYGVELVLKKTDYIVMDDRKVGDSKDQKDAPPPPSKDSDDDLEVDDIAPLHPEDLSALGMKAASFIMKSEDPFSMLNKVTRDFPRYSASLAKAEVDPDFETEYMFNRQKWVVGGENLVWINGKHVQAKEMNVHALMDDLRRERRIIDSIKDLGFSASEAIGLISHQALSEGKSEEEPQRFDWRDADEGGEAIVWLNDLEKDTRYEDWPDSEQYLLRQVYPGQIHSIRKNIHTIVVPLDLSNHEDITLLVSQLTVYVQRKVALHIGVLPILKTEDARNQAKLLYHLIDIYGLKTAIDYFTEAVVISTVKLPSASGFKELVEGVKTRGDEEALSLEQVLEDNDRLKPAIAYGKRLDIGTSPPPVFVNGYVVPRTENWVQAMSQVLATDVQACQRKVARGGPGPHDLITYLLRDPAKRRNRYIFPDDQDNVEVINVASVMKKHDGVIKELPFIAGKRDEENVAAAVDLWIVGDFDTEHGYGLLKGAAGAQSTTPNVNIVAINNPEQIPKSPMLSTLLYHLRGTGIYDTPGILEQIVNEQTPEKDFVDLPHVESIPEIVQQKAKTEGWATPDKVAAKKFWESCGGLLKDLKFKPGERGVILNGRVVGPLPGDADLEKDDFTQLISFELSKRIRPALAAVKDIGKLDLLKRPHDVAKLTSILSLSGRSELPQGIFGGTSTVRYNTYKEWEGKHTAITMGDESDSIFNIVAAINPASEKAQKLVSILRVLAKLKKVDLKIYLNPERELGELPVKRFYRYVLQEEPKFDSDGNRAHPKALFKGIPQNILVTLGMDVPPSWLVAPKECIHDLDNIKLSAFKARFGHSDVTAVYELTNILIDGHSRELTAGGQPPAGTQLILGSKRHPHAVDTLVMANLGYFQFKVNPGFWNMELMSGRSTKIFTLESAGSKGYFAQPGDESPEITLMSFNGITLYPRLGRNPGMENVDILDPENEDDSALGKAKKYADGFLSKMGILKGKETPSGQAEINIFSVASGHLYERFISIMILSVMKNTNKTVKFWFIENFLSPSFKNFIPVMAEEYKFQFELVTYKWPHWLRAQKEKQREIWGYKILFLDVLFPLDLDKVIFVDADQIVRTDLKELVDLDLHGAPYGFTPMCDSRTEIEGFRFWKTGYWQNFLRGKPYHISALYVVDLKKFRGLAAGDRLRQQYHQLSADPNSLANLDQDLPNHMQMLNLPIFSLPQDWLWCETWCSDESLKTAKTIDLCNNPMTKEPKLDRARRQVPEWNEYDEEVAKLAERKSKSGGEGVGYMREAVVQKEALGEQEKNKVKEKVDPAKESPLVKDEL